MESLTILILINMEILALAGGLLWLDYLEEMGVQ